MLSEDSGYKRIDHPIPPLYDSGSRILILGSFPSVKSREAAFFYGHPANRFWKTLAGVLSEDVPVTIEEKKQFLHDHHIAVWDVIRSCHIIGSSDSSIRNVVTNDLSEILQAAPIRQIFCNGARSFELYGKYLRLQTGMEAIKLPSTSPANAAFSLDRLTRAWKQICGPLKVVPPGLADSLLAWYDDHARLLPWRQEPTPYHVWISEIMLQQTRVEAVRGYYDRWMEALPDIKSLAEAEDDRLLKLWEGLGYYNRVRNLKKAAIIVMRDYGGRLPEASADLLKLPGIGDYTAGAIASIAYGQAEPAVDGNVLRIFSRLLMEEGEIDRPQVRRLLTKEVRRAMPRQNEGEDSARQSLKGDAARQNPGGDLVRQSLGGDADRQSPGGDVDWQSTREGVGNRAGGNRAGDYNQALMDLGATLCLPAGRPNCDRCPLASICQAHLHDCETDYPRRKEKKARRVEKRSILVIEEVPPAGGKQGPRIVLHQRPGDGLLPGLWEFPGLTGAMTLAQVRELADQWGLEDAEIEELGKAKHIFSHIEWQMTGYRIRVAGLPDALLREMSWCLADRNEIRDRYAIPSAFDPFLI